MKISFMTLGCPNWDLDTICKNGKKYGFDGVDFRGYLDSIDITTRPEFTIGAAGTRRQINDTGLEVSAISSSIQVCVLEKRADNLEEARRTIAVANSLGATNIRIFGGGDLNTCSQSELAAIGAETVDSLLTLDGASDLHWLFETHDIWAKAQNCRLLLEAIPDAAFGALWDLGNAYMASGEEPAETFAALSGRVGYTHIKDAKRDANNPLAMPDGWYYVLPGTGDLPLAASIRILKENGYDGWLQFEHEKRWIPSLLEPEVVFPVFAQWTRSLV